MIMAGGPTDEVKQPVDPVRTDYRKGRGGSGHDVVRGAVIIFFCFLFFGSKITEISFVLRRRAAGRGKF